VRILECLKKHSFIEPFLYPVDEKRDGAKNYYKIIKEPMDLETIERKLTLNEYK
jgi:hypothetical protein